MTCCEDEKETTVQTGTQNAMGLGNALGLPEGLGIRLLVSY